MTTSQRCCEDLTAKALISVWCISEFCVSARYINRSHRKTYLEEKTGLFLDVLSARSLWETAIRQLENSLRTLKQGLDRAQGWEWPPEEGVKLFRNTVQIREGPKKVSQGKHIS